MMARRPDSTKYCPSLATLQKIDARHASRCRQKRHIKRVIADLIVRVIDGGLSCQAGLFQTEEIGFGMDSKKVGPGNGPGRVDHDLLSQRTGCKPLSNGGNSSWDFRMKSSAGVMIQVRWVVNNDNRARHEDQSCKSTQGKVVS